MTMTSGVSNNNLDLLDADHLGDDDDEEEEEEDGAQPGDRLKFSTIAEEDAEEDSLGDDDGESSSDSDIDYGMPQ
jgi:hypothetical protein